MNQQTEKQASAGRFHIISIHMRRFPGDRAYSIRESFTAPSVVDACRKHATYRGKGVFTHVLRDGSTGRRYSVCDSIEVCASAAIAAAS